ncbi:MAG: flagellar basal body P-ring protein FlgI, partial [Planctomycetales bacterium]|nr:flagellar basal body P-ring protein FlgI [Planctomycetales bacterium]
MRKTIANLLTLLAVWAVMAALPDIAGDRAVAGTSIESICHVKGLEENTLVGVGLVVGLNGTGDSAAFTPTIQAFAAQLQRMGQPVAGGAGVAATRNVA